MVVPGVHNIGVAIGFTVGHSAVASSTQNVNSADMRLAHGFMLREAKTLNSATVYVNGVTGTLTGLSLALCPADANGDADEANPIETSTTISGGLPTGARFVTFTGFTTALSANTQYFLVFSNTTGTPASNYPTVRVFQAPGAGQDWQSNAAQNSPYTPYGWMYHRSDDAGATWPAGNAAAGANIRLTFSDGTNAGRGISQTQTLGTTYGIFATNVAGVRARVYLPADVYVRSVNFPLTVTSDPTNPLEYRIYDGGVLVGTTSTFPQALAKTTAWLELPFAKPVRLRAGWHDLRIVGATSGSDASTLRYNFAYWDIEDSDASRSCYPYGSILTRSTDNGATWTDYNTRVVPGWLMVCDWNEPGRSAPGPRTRIVR